MTAVEKLRQLENRLRELGSVAVAFSGGVDSSLLLAVARRVLGDKAIAITAVSATYPRAEQEEAAALARQLGARHIVIATKELDDPRFLANPPERCYHCKKALAAELKAAAAGQGIAHVALGSNSDDRQDFRPGRRAAEEEGLLEPMVDAGLTKAEIRQLAREMGLPNWDRPAAACLASRIPYGTSLDVAKLRQVEEAEDCLHELGFRQARVRHHGDLARIEVEPQEIPRAAELGAEITKRLKALGFTYVALDLQGYRTGSMNEQLRGKG